MNNSQITFSTTKYPGNLLFWICSCFILFSSQVYAVPTGTIIHPKANRTYDGNLRVFFKANDTTALNSVGLLIGNNNNITFCNGNCTNRYRGVRTGINPIDIGLNPGTNTISLWANSPDNIIDTVSFNWQATEVTGINFERSLGQISFNWSALPGYHRYHFYIASESGVTPRNVTTLENGQAFRSLRSTNHTVTNLVDDISYYVRISGINASGESAFSREIAIPAIDNQLPVAVNDQFTLNEDQSIQSSVMDNDFDPDNEGNANPPQTLVASLIESTSNGSLDFQSSGDFTYTPDANFNGTDSFSYQIKDDFEGIDQATVVITIRPVNDAPVAVNDSFNINEDNTLTVAAAGLLNNDSDIDNDTLSVNPTPVQPPQFGTLNLASNGGFTYTPNSNFSGTDSFVYGLSDGAVTNQPTAQVTITVNPINDPPNAQNDAFSTNEDTPVQGNVLNNDTDNDVIDGNKTAELTVSLLSDVSNGSLSLNNDGTFDYTPQSNFFGSDSFQYRITDTAGATSEAQVTLTVNSVNDLPVAENDAYTIDEDNTLTVSVENGLLANDADIDINDSISFEQLTSQVQHGSIQVEQDGSFVYTPDDNFNGVESFTYSITDTAGDSASAAVEITINSIPDAPIVENDTANAIAGEATELSPLDNDTNLDGETSELVIISAVAENGTVVINQSRTLTYTANGNFEGTDNISYEVRHGSDTNAPASNGSIAVEVILPNDPPTANDDSATLDEDSNVTINVLANDTDPENDPLTVINADASTGNVTINTDNTLLFVPDENFNGNATITYTIEDARNQTDSALVSVTVNPVNDLPVVENETITIAEDTNITIDVLANDSDADEDTLTIASATASEGDVEITSDQQLIYTPDTNFNGNVTINYSVSDGNGGSATGVVNVTVTAVNDNPIANDDTGEVISGGTVTLSPLVNDSDPDGDPLSVSSVSASIGSASVSGNTQVIYNAPANFNGTASVNYLVTDGNGGSDGGVITITVTPSNQSPTALPDSYVVTSNGNVVNVPAEVGVLENDSDPEGVTLTASILTAPAYASSFTLNSDGSFDYLHDSTNNLTDSFTYSVSDGTNTSTGSVTLSIHVSNYVPEVCSAPPTQATENMLYSYSIEATDKNEDTLTYSADGLPSWLSINASTGVISGTPTASDASATNIQYKVSDYQSSSSEFTFSINLQSEFGTANQTSVNLGFTGDAIEAMTLDNSGRIIAVGANNGDFIIVRLLPDGTQDSSFGVGGIKTVDFGSTDHAYGVAVDKQNRIVVVGQTTDTTNGDAEIGIIRLTADGSLDTTFGDGDGMVEYDVDTNTPDYAYDLYIHDNTDITVIGHYHNGTDVDIVAMQLLDNGILDSTFGDSSNGKLIFLKEQDQKAYSVISDEEGNLYIGGTHNNGTDDDVLIARINMDSDANGDEDGNWDTNFDTDGLFTYDGGNTERGEDINFDADGNLVLVGLASNQFGIYNFTTTPSLNTSGFNSPNGFLLHDITSSSVETATEVIRDEKGNLYVFGKADDDIGIIKVQLDGTLDTGFGSSGELVVAIDGSSNNRVSAMLNGTGQLLYADTDTTAEKMLFFQKNDITDGGFTDCNLTKVIRGGNSTSTTDTIVDVVEAGSNELYAVGFGKPNAADPTDILIYKINSNGGNVNEFGNAGVVRKALGADFETNSAVTTSTQDLIVTGYYDLNQLRVEKFNVSGNLDSTYPASSARGTLSTYNVKAFGSSMDSSDNLIIATSENSTPSIKLFKLNSSGDLDTTFDSDGITEIANADGKEMAVSAEGSIYIGGDISGQPVVIKFKSDGSLDTGFGSAGIYTFTTAATSSMKSITVLNDNSVVALIDNSGPELKKLDSSGNLDSNFSVDLSLYMISTNASVQSDTADNIYVQLNDSSANPVMLKMSNNGVWSKDFLNAGQGVITGNVAGWTNVKGFTIESTGQMVIFGENNDDFAFAHMDKNGTIIAGEFGLQFDFGFGDHGYSIDMDRKGRIVVAGSSYDPTGFEDDQAIARFLNNGSIDTTIDDGDGIHIEDGADTERFIDLSINTRSKATVTGVDELDLVAGLLEPNAVNIEGAFNSAAYLVDSAVTSDVVNAHYADDKGDIWTAGSKANKGRVEKILRGGNQVFAFAESPGGVNYELNQLNSNSELLGITGTSDGKFVAAGKISGTSEYDGIVVKFDSDGTLDTSFDSDGILYIGVENNLDNILNDVVLSDDGEILVVGEQNNQIYLGKLSNAGVSTSSTTITSSDSQVAVAAEVDRFGGIFVAVQNEHGFELYRFKSDWSVLTHYPPRDIGEASKVRDLTIDSIGNVYLTGSAQIEQEWDIFVLKYPSAVGSFQNLGLD